MFSEHWLHNFKKRYGVSLKQQNLAAAAGGNRVETAELDQSQQTLSESSEQHSPTASSHEEPVEQPHTPSDEPVGSAFQSIINNASNASQQQAAATMLQMQQLLLQQYYLSTLMGGATATAGSNNKQQAQSLLAAAGVNLAEWYNKTAVAAAQANAAEGSEQSTSIQ